MNGIFGHKSANYGIQQNIREKELNQDAHVRHLNRVHSMDDKHAEKHIQLTSMFVRLLKRLGSVKVEWNPQVNRALTVSQITDARSGEDIKAVMVAEKKQADS